MGSSDTCLKSPAYFLRHLLHSLYWYSRCGLMVIIKTPHHLLQGNWSNECHPQERMLLMRGKVWARRPLYQALAALTPEPPGPTATTSLEDYWPRVTNLTIMCQRGDANFMTQFYLPTRPTLSSTASSPSLDASGWCCTRGASSGHSII